MDLQQAEHERVDGGREGEEKEKQDGGRDEHDGERRAPAAGPWAGGRARRRRGQGGHRGPSVVEEAGWAGDRAAPRLRCRGRVGSGQLTLNPAFFMSLTVVSCTVFNASRNEVWFWTALPKASE
ncbi:hypothetical protein GCM10025864_12480 [Luteimicrobium album]|uniref:Uncharacterized protein n=1 Tax=Luteimicrobium album TaxID=1054550 RepID=A0ABQ6I0K2_9MICO|nr:hypothetical protein GCM10025864_12480 [Luteimicrobium album]